VTHADDALVSGCDFDIRRTRLLTPRAPLPRYRRKNDGNNGPKGRGDGGDDHPCVVYWMIRDVRVADNWALLFARNLAVKENVPLRVVYALPPPPDTAASGGGDGSPPKPSDMPMTARHGRFLVEGLRVASSGLAEGGVAFDVLRPDSRSSVGASVSSHCVVECEALAVVCDMSPLRHHRDWTERQAAPLFENAGVPLYQVDAHNVVPVWAASGKREVGARTLRPKINSVFASYCTHFPVFNGNAHLKRGGEESKSIGGGGEEEVEHDWEGYEAYLNLDASVDPVDGVRGGHDAAMERFRDFCTSKQHGLKNFDTLRNDPNQPSVCSNLSPYINHGHVSFQRLALNVRALKVHPNGTSSYIEEGVVRRELSDNFVYYSPDVYDSLDAAAGWARESLELHAVDEREKLYSWREMEGGMTHDDLWNAAQLQLVREGKMHGFVSFFVLSCRGGGGFVVVVVLFSARVV
jgi:deoxyribodipyrimidine photo-lyase